MYLAFVDRDSVKGTVSTDWTVEYDGQFTDTIETVVSDAQYNGNATAKELQELSLDLFGEGQLAEIRFVEDTQRHDERDG